MKEVCREEVTRMEDSANAGDAPAAPSIHPSQAMLGDGNLGGFGILCVSSMACYRGLSYAQAQASYVRGVSS